MHARRFRLTRPLTVLWRDDGTLQLGLDGDGAVLIPGAPRAADAALRALRVPRTLLEVRHLVPDQVSSWLPGAIAALESAGLIAEADPEPRGRVVVVGSGVLADAVIEMLDAEGVEAARREPGPVPDSREALVVVCAETVEPDRVLTRELAASGTPHLVVRGEPERAVVGPFVSLGSAACLACTDLLRRDLDPAWPFLLAQLCRTRHTPTRAQASWAAAMASAQVTAWLSGRRPETLGATLELEGASGLLGSRRWPLHPDCACALAAA